MAYDCSDSSGAGAEGARAGNKRPRAPKCKPGEETSGVQFKRAPQSWGAHQRRRQPAAHPRPGSQPASGPSRRAGSATAASSLDMTGARAAMPCPPPSIQSGRATGETRGLEVETGRPGLEIRTQYKIHCTGSLVPRRECARTVRSSSKASNPTFQPLIGSQEPPRIPVIKMLVGLCAFKT